MIQSSAADAVRFLSLLARPGDVFELRGLKKIHGQQHVNAGYFDDMALLAKAAIAQSGTDDGVYITLNPCLPALLARAPANRVRRAGNGDTTSDRDVRIRRNILIDVDPVRPTGISSTDEEHESAIALAIRIEAALTAAGWPAPICADSGNGGHLIYSVDLPVDDGGLVKRVLARLSELYTTPSMKVDEKVFNAARISKIYGTLTKKGENTADRPHRVSKIIHAPAALATVTREQLEAFAPVSAGLQNLRAKVDQHATTNGTNGARPRFDLDVFIAEHLPDAIPQTWSEGRKWLLPICPFNDSHDRKEAYITELSRGGVAAGCQHESCRWDWRELRSKFEPGVYDRSRDKLHRNGATTQPSAEVEVLFEDPAAIAEISQLENRVPSAAPVPPTLPAALETRHPWWRAPALVDEILRYVNDPWVSLTLGGDELARVRAGGIAVVMGGSGSGKSSLVSGLLVEHAKNVGPAIALSIELPADELAGRIVGMRCDASWEDALRGKVRREFMDDALNLPRLYVIDRKHATLANLGKAIDAARAEYPREPILAAIDYAQLLQSPERETRQKVADAIERIDGLTREKRVVAIAVSQMSRSAAKQARDGEKLGADSADGGAESAAIERFATLTLSIGKAGQPREDGSCHVELSLGKGRMSGGDKVFPMAYWGRTGKWLVTGNPQISAEILATRQVELDTKKQKTIELALYTAADRSSGPRTREELMEGIVGSHKIKRAAMACLIARGELVEVTQKRVRAQKNAWLVWTPDRCSDAGIPLVRDLPDASSSRSGDDS